MNMRNKTKIGQGAENMACEYLIKQGYKILEQNWRFKHLEIDIIAEKDNLLVVVEVKYRQSVSFGEPEVFVNKQKQKFLIEAINQYIRQKDIDREVRFDIIAISKLSDTLYLNHIEDAFYAQ